MGDMARWMGAIKDVKEGANKAKAKKKYGSIEEEAFEEFAALKEAERMENELRQFVNMNYGPQSWAQIVKLQADIRIREQEARLQAEREREEAIERLCIWIGVISVVILFIFMIVVAYKVAASTMIIQSVTRGNITPWV